MSEEEAESVDEEEVEELAEEEGVDGDEGVASETDDEYVPGMTPMKGNKRHHKGHKVEVTGLCGGLVVYDRCEGMCV